MILSDFNFIYVFMTLRLYDDFKVLYLDHDLVKLDNH